MKSAGAIFLFFLAALAPLMMGLAAGFDRPYYQVADCDLYYVYHAARFVEGLPQMVFAHTGYAVMLVISWWFDLMHALGALPAATVRAVQESASVEEAITEMVFAGRVLSVVLSSAFVILVGLVAARLAGSAMVGGALAVVAAASPGISFQAIIIRPELVSGVMVLAAFAAVAASRYSSRRMAFVLLGVAAAAAYLSVLAKLQAVIPILMLPAFGLVWGERGPAATVVPTNDPARNWAIMLLSLVAFLPFATTHFYGAKYFLNRGQIPLYVWAVVAWAVFSVAAFALINRRGGWFAAFSLAMLGIGLSAGSTVNYIFFSLENPGKVTAFVEAMQAFVRLADAPSQGLAMIDTVILRSRDVIDDLLLSNPTSGIARVVIYGGSLVVAAYLGVRGRRQAALAMAVLTLTAAATAFAFSLRGFRPEYGVYFCFMPLFAWAIGYRALAGVAAIERTGFAAALIVAIVALHGYGNYKAFLEVPYATANSSDPESCKWQTYADPFFPPGSKRIGTCWRPGSF